MKGPLCPGCHQRVRRVTRLPGGPGIFRKYCSTTCREANEVRAALRNVSWRGHFMPQRYSDGLKEISVIFDLPREDPLTTLRTAEAAARECLKQVTDHPDRYFLRGVARTS